MRHRSLFRSLLLCCFGVVFGWMSLFASCAPTTVKSDAPTKDGGHTDAKATPDTGSKDQGASEKPADRGASEPPVDTGTPDTGSPDTGTPETAPSDKAKTSGAVWYGDVQTIVQKNCQVCHSAGGVAPFTLTTFEEVKAKASIVEWSVKNKRMPPWLPSAAQQCEPFKHSINLSQKDIDSIVAWVKDGTPQGDPKNATNYAPKQDKLEWVDADVDIQTDYTPPATSPDDYHCFLTKKVLTTSRELTGFQLVPGVREMVHHVLIYGVSQSQAAQLQSQHKSTHWACGTGALFNGSATLLGVWVPGTDVVRFPKDTGMTMNANDQIVLEFHYNLSALKAPKPDRSAIRLQFARTPVKHKLRLQLQVQLGISIPPKSKGIEVKHTKNVSAPIRLWGIMPHMHKQGTKFSLTVQNPGTNKSCMIDIPRWDYGWQQTFFFNQPGGLLLKGGEQIFMKCTFDNPTDKTIRWGDRTGDEMCLNFFFVSAP